MNTYIKNSFQMPNAFVDLLMRDVSGNAVKTYLLILRKTVGWQKKSDSISLSQFMEFCGIKKADTARSALKELEKLGLIRAEKQQGKMTRFFLNTLPENFEDDTETEPENGGTTSAKNGGSTPAKRRGVTPAKNGVSTKHTITKHTITKNRECITRDEKQKHDKANSHEIDLKTLQNLGVADQYANDWLQTRKDKRAGRLTASAIEFLQDEAQKANLTVAQAVEVSAKRNWARFVASYLMNEQARFVSNSGKTTSHSRERENLITKKYEFDRSIVQTDMMYWVERSRNDPDKTPIKGIDF